MSDSSSALSGSGSDNAYASEQEDVPDVGTKTDGIGRLVLHLFFFCLFFFNRIRIRIVLAMRHLNRGINQTCKR